MAGAKRFATGLAVAVVMMLLPTLAMAAAPTVDNLPGATDIQSISAKLQGHLLTTGGQPTTVQAYWGDNDGVTTVLNWDNTQDLGLTGAGVVTLDVTGLVPNRTYFYRFHATNVDGDTWASPTVSFTTSLNAGPAPLDLLSMTNFMILSGAAITTTGGGTIDGDVGASPIAGSAVAVTDAQVNGVIYVVDASGPAGSVIDVPRLDAAKGDLTIAYNDAAGRTPVPTGTFLNPGSGNLGGLILVPGLYKFTSTALITGADLTLKGGPNDVWIFQIGTDLQLGSGIKVILAGGAQARNIFWQVGTSAVLGTGSTFKGTILADQAITLMTGATMEGRALAFSAGVTYNGVGSLVPPANEAPVAVDDTLAAIQDTTLTYVQPGVLVNDTDNEGNPLTAIKVTDPLHGVLTLNANGSLTYEPTLGYSGPDSFTYKANDGALDSNTATVNINVVSVNTAPVAVLDAYSTDEDTTLTVVVPGVLTNDTDTEGNPLTAIKVTDPANGVLTLNVNGSFTYVPTLNYNGLDSFTYKANDGLLDSNTVTVSLTINAVNDAPVTVLDSGTTDEDTTLTVVAPGVLGNDTDVEGDTLTAVLVTNVSNGTLTLNSNGSYTYAPNANYNGADSFTYKANDGTVDGNTVTVSLTITAVNDAPVAVPNAYSTDEDVTLTVVAPGVLGNDTDVDADSMTAVLVTDVSHGTLTLNADGSFTYVPTPAYNGADSFTYKANDGTVDSNTVTVTLTINAVNDAPVAVLDSYTTPEDTTLTVVAPGVLGNDTDTEGDALAAVLVANVTHGSLTLNANGSFIYVPTANYNGPDSFTYKANDGFADSNTVTVTITVTAVNDAPVAVVNAYSTNEDVTLTVVAPGVLGNDTDVDADPLTAVLVTDVTHGTLTLNTDGSFTYVPTPAYNGSDSFTYKANDGTVDSNTVMVSLTIIPVNDAPVAAADAYSTNEDTTLTVVAPGVLSNDTDVDGDSLTAVLVTNVSNGSLTLNSNGSFTYVPTANYNGSDSFTYKANDGFDDSNIVTVTITVIAVNDTPVAVVDTGSTNEDTTLTVVAPGVLGNDTDIDGDSLSAFLVTNVSNGTLTLNANGSFSYVPNANFNGVDSFTYKANDGTIDSNTVTVSLTITAVNDVPVAVADSYTTDEDLLLTVAAPGVLANDTDVEGSALTAILVANVAHGTLVLNANGSFTYMPVLDYNGADSFTYKANDGTADSSVVTVSLTITPVADIPLWYPEIPYTAVAGFTWYNFELWDRVPTAAGAVRVINTNIHGTGMTTAEEYFLVGNDGLLPGTYYWRYRTWNPEGSSYGSTWLPSSSGQLLTVVDYGNPLSPIALSVSPSTGVAGDFDVSFMARNAQGYDLEITGTLSANNQTLSPIAFMPSDDHVMPFNPSTIHTITLAGPDTVTWRVRGYNPLGKSAWVSGPAITVTAGVGNPVPGVPDYRTMRPEDAAVVTAPTGTAFFAFQWEPVAGAAGYLIHLATHSGGQILNFVDVGNVTRVDTINGAKIALPPGSYQWSVEAYNAAVPRVYGGWNHSPQSPGSEKPLNFEVIVNLVAPTMTAASKASVNTANISWVGSAPATVRMELYYGGAPGGWQILDNRPVTVTGPGTGTVNLGRNWGGGTNYLLLTGKTAGGSAGPRSGLFIIP